MVTPNVLEIRRAGMARESAATDMRRLSAVAAFSTILPRPAAREPEARNSPLHRFFDRRPDSGIDERSLV
jgi:hypothetical protein